MPEQGDLVLVPVPFTDLSSQKRRPVIVISNEKYNRLGADVGVMAMTSNPAAVPYNFRIQSTELVQGALNRSGTIHADNIYTLAKSIIVKKFGKVSPAVLDRIRGAIAELMAT